MVIIEMENGKKSSLSFTPILLRSRVRILKSL